MADLISKPLRAFLDAADGYWSITEKERSRLIYLNSNALRVHGFKDLNSAEGRELEEIKSSLANYAVTFREQNELILSSAEPREFFDTHFCGDNQWHCFHGRKEPFYADDDNDAEHDAPYTDESIAGITYHGNDITTPATIELARYLAAYDGCSTGQVSYLIGAPLQPYPLSETQQCLLFWQLRDTPKQVTAQRLGCSDYQLEAQQQLWQYLDVNNHQDCVAKAIALGYQQMLPKSLFFDYEPML